MLAAVLGVVAASTFAAAIPSQWNPVADPAAVVVQDRARFTVLTPHMVRMEYTPPEPVDHDAQRADTATFEDHATLTVVNRLLPVPPFKWTPAASAGGVATLDTGVLTLTYNASAGVPAGSFTGATCVYLSMCCSRMRL